MEGDDKGIVCVTGGTGYIASWLIMRLLQDGYKVHTTIRSYPDPKKDISFLTNLPNALENLQIFNADLDRPASFVPAIEGSTGVFHVAHPMDFYNEEPEQVKHKRAIDGTLEILRACLNSKTVKRVVYTSSASAVAYNKEGSSVVDESVWSDAEFIRSLGPVGASYYIGKTLTERAVLEFGEEHGLDVVSVLPVFVNGGFICPRLPDSVSISLAMIFGQKDLYPLIAKLPLVHIDDVASACIYLLEYPDAKGRYICSLLDITIDKMSEFLSARYPQYQIPPADGLKEIEGFKFPDFSSKKLLDTGFKYKYGLEEMFDGAIQSCKEKGFL